ncbi:hypothetical protein COLO4_15222 [Corchorus olitorius]|uniref:Uncharacterized protein n=1 Tax=Corchorus olitorius TaxID=93759 RepID=A0A1R3JNR8_9ROSI|nr:hypothetical protein COLO4_15222 [Corchorus olitorius]
MGHLAYVSSVGKEDTLHENALMVGKIYRESSTPKVRSRRENKDIWGYKSATRDHGKSPKRTTFLYEKNDDFFGYKSAPHGHGKSPKRKTFLYEENDNFFGYKSAPHDHGKSPKRKKIQYEEKGLSTPRHIKQRGGWIAEDPEEFSHSHRKSKRNHWSSPSTPSYEGRMKSITSSGRASGSQSSKQNSHRYSASRFNNFGHNEPGTNYHWW